MSKKPKLSDPGSMHVLDAEEIKEREELTPTSVMRDASELPEPEPLEGEPPKTYDLHFDIPPPESMNTLDDIEPLCDELGQLIDAGPGMDEGALRRVRAIFSEIHDHSTVSHTREKLVDLTTNFSIWLSHHRWRRYGAGGKRLRKTLVDDLEKLHSAWNSFERKT